MENLRTIKIQNAEILRQINASSKRFQKTLNELKADVKDLKRDGVAVAAPVANHATRSLPNPRVVLKVEPVTEFAKCLTEKDYKKFDSMLNSSNSKVAEKFVRRSKSLLSFSISLYGVFAVFISIFVFVSLRRTKICCLFGLKMEKQPVYPNFIDWR